MHGQVGYLPGGLVFVPVVLVLVVIRRVSTLRAIFEAQLCQVFLDLVPPHFPVPFASPFFAQTIKLSSTWFRNKKPGRENSIEYWQPLARR